MPVCSSLGVGIVATRVSEGREVMFTMPSLRPGTAMRIDLGFIEESELWLLLLGEGEVFGMRQVAKEQKFRALTGSV